MLDKQEYQKRRELVISQMQPNSIAIVTANREIKRNGDANYRFRQDSYFSYLTGFEEPDAVLILLKEEKLQQYILFTRPRDKEMEIWNGRRAGIEGAVCEFGADHAYPIAELDERLLELLLDKECIYYCHAHDKQLDDSIRHWCNQLKAKVRRGIVAPQQIINLEQILDEMRLIKSQAELNVMKHVAKISANAHLKAMKASKTFSYEYQYEALLLSEFVANGCRASAYDSIVGSGENACILHYTQNDARLNDNELVLIDAGGEYLNYAADITRTFPIKGRFSNEQKAIYEVVLKAQKEGVACVKPGNPWDSVQQVMVQIITEGLVELGILKGEVNTLIDEQAYREFYMHNSGHWLGLDVHDVGNYKIDGQWRRFKPGMVLTVEPGIYIAGGNPTVDSKWWNIGVRIEDDVIVTDSGCEVITAAVPKEVEDIERVMN